VRANVFRVHPITDIGGATCPLPIWRPAVFFSNSLPIGTTRTPQKSSRSRRTMNAASLFDRLVGRYMIVVISFSLFPKIGPIPTPATPGSSGLFSMRRVAPQSAHECQLPPPAVETPRELSASAKGVTHQYVPEHLELDHEQPVPGLLGPPQFQWAYPCCASNYDEQIRP
jgi:hypothetical protein